MQPPPRRGFARRLLSAAGRAVRSVGRTITGRQPEPTPAPPQREAPRDEGFGPDYGAEPPSRDYGDFIDYREPEEEYYEPEPWEPEIDLYDATGAYVGSHTKEEWFQELLKSKEELLYEYGFDNLDIIDALIEAGEWDADDWRTWRELYDSL